MTHYVLKLGYIMWLISWQKKHCWDLVCPPPLLVHYLGGSQSVLCEGTLVPLNQTTCPILLKHCKAPWASLQLLLEQELKVKFADLCGLIASCQLLSKLKRTLLVKISNAYKTIWWKVVGWFHLIEMRGYPCFKKWPVELSWEFTGS